MANNRTALISVKILEALEHSSRLAMALSSELSLRYRAASGRVLTEGRSSLVPVSPVRRQDFGRRSDVAIRGQHPEANKERARKKKC